MRFDIEVKLPSGKVQRVEELCNRDYLTIVKYIHNDDYYGLNKFFENLVLDKALNIFDRFYLLIYYRMVFVDSIITITKNEKHIDVDLTSVLDKIESSYRDFEVVFVEKNIEVVLDLPNISYYTSIDEMFFSTIKTLKIDSNLLNFEELSTKEQTEILDNLPVEIFNKIKSYIETIASDLLDVTVISENKFVGVERLGVNVINNGIIDFIANIFNTDLDQFYKMLYYFQNTITPGSDIFFELSPIETKILMNQHNKRIEEENKELKKNQQQQQ
jgi:hypothetical protein